MVAANRKEKNPRELKAHKRFFSLIKKRKVNYAVPSSTERKKRQKSNERKH